MNISIRLPDPVIKKIDTLSSYAHLTRAQYIREALEFYNGIKYEEVLRERFMEVSQKVRAESMKVNEEFGEIERDL